MKKLLALIFLFSLTLVSMAQVGKSLTFTPTTNDSIVGAATKYCTLASPITGQWSGTVYVKITPSISSSDSTHVWVEQSYDGTNWFKSTGLGTPMLSVGTYYSANTVTTAAGYDYKGRMGTSAAAWLWSPTWYFNAPYYRIAVQHFKAATSVKITTAKMYIKR